MTPCGVWLCWGPRGGGAVIPGLLRGRHLGQVPGRRGLVWHGGGAGLWGPPPLPRFSFLMPCGVRRAGVCSPGQPLPPYPPARCPAASCFLFPPFVLSRESPGAGGGGGREEASIFPGSGFWKCAFAGGQITPPGQPRRTLQEGGLEQAGELKIAPGCIQQPFPPCGPPMWEWGPENSAQASEGFSLVRHCPRAPTGLRWLSRPLPTHSSSPSGLGGPGSGNLPASRAVAAAGWAGNLGVPTPTPPSGCGCRAAPVTLALLARDSFFRMRPPGVASFRLKGLRPAGSPLVLTFGFSWATLWATADARSP